MATWTIDPSHTDVAFAVRHMGLSTVRGRFATVGGTIETNDDGTPSTISVDIDTASISTGSGDRDQHLRSPDFFDADAHPTITFRSTAITAKGDDRYDVTGTLDMHGVSRDVTLDAEIGNAIQDPFGLTRRAATATVTINRKDWGLTWNQILEAGALLVAENVTLTIDVQATERTS